MYRNIQIYIEINIQRKNIQRNKHIQNNSYFGAKNNKKRVYLFLYIDKTIDIQRNKRKQHFLIYRKKQKVMYQCVWTH